MIRHVSFACRTTKATDIHSARVILLFHGNNSDASAPYCYVTCRRSVLLFMGLFYNQWCCGCDCSPYHTVHCRTEGVEQAGNNSSIYPSKHKKCKKLFSFITTYQRLTLFMFALLEHMQCFSL